MKPVPHQGFHWPRKMAMPALIGIGSLMPSESRIVICASLRACYIICDIILFAVTANRCESLHVHLTDFFATEIVAANRCVLLQALASSENG